MKKDTWQRYVHKVEVKKNAGQKTGCIISTEVWFHFGKYVTDKAVLKHGKGALHISCLKICSEYLFPNNKPEAIFAKGLDPTPEDPWEAYKTIICHTIWPCWIYKIYVANL